MEELKVQQWKRNTKENNTQNSFGASLSPINQPLNNTHFSDRRRGLCTWTPKVKIQTYQLLKSLPQIPVMLQKKTVTQNSKLN